MVLSLQQNTQILHYLQQRNLDRLILNDFIDEKTITNSEKKVATLNKNDGIIYDNSFTLQATENVIFKFPRILFNKFDKLRIIIETEDKLEIDNVECFLSITKEAQIKNVPCQVLDSENKSADNFYELLFSIPFEDNNQTSDGLDISNSKYSNDLSNIQSIFIDFKSEINVNIHDIAIFNDDYDTSLEMIEEAYIEATNYVSEWLSESQMKEKTVLNAITKLTAINLWLIEMQKEQKYLSGYQGTRNYYDQLLVQVENVIRKFNPDFNKETSDDNKSTINTNLIGSI